MNKDHDYAALALKASYFTVSKLKGLCREAIWNLKYPACFSKLEPVLYHDTISYTYAN